MTNAEKFFEKIKDKKVAFIGIGVSHTDVIRQFAEKGIATEAVAEICGTAFFELSIRRISAIVFADNIASAKVLQKNGFELEGTMRRAAIKDNKIYDLLLFGRLLMPCPI